MKHQIGDFRPRLEKRRHFVRENIGTSISERVDIISVVKICSLVCGTNVLEK